MSLANSNFPLSLCKSINSRILSLLYSINLLRIYVTNAVNLGQDKV